MAERRNPLLKWLGGFLLLAGGLLTANNLFFAANPEMAEPLFTPIDILVLLGCGAVLIDLVRSTGGGLALCAFAVAGHLYAYNFIAKVAESGMVNATVWLLIDPAIAALFLWKGLHYLRSA